MNKKSTVSIYITMVGFFLALTMFYLYFKPQTIEPTIGEIQIATLKAMQEAEKDLTYIDNSAKIAAYQAIDELGNKGGFKDKSDCGAYGFNLWNNKDKECFPDYKNNFNSLFNDRLNRFLTRFNLIDNYNFLIEQKDKLNIIGLAINDLTLDIRIIKEIIKTVVEYIAPVNAEDIVKNIKERYRDKILEEINKNDPKPEESLIIGVIAQESKGDPNIISPTGCAGLMQFCYGTAEDFKDIFMKLTPCDCTGELCKTAPKCNINNDDRLNPDKSIEVGVKYISQLLKQFNKYDDKEKFAIASYNGGSEVIKKAIEKSSRDSWPEIAQQLTPDLITYFKNYEQKRKKVQEIIGYVNSVMGYKHKYEELNQNQITGAVIKTLSGDSLGKYSINPSFKVDINYNLEEYQNAINDAKELIKKCENKANIKLCIDSEIKNKNYVEDCETEKEKVVNDFIEFYEGCYESNDFDCYCEMDINYNENYEFNIDYDEKNYYIEDKEFKSNDADFIEYYKINKNEFELKNKDNKIDGKKLVIYKEKIISKFSEDIIQLNFGGKKKNDKLELLIKKKIENPRLCKLKQQRKLKFCYDTKKKILTEGGTKESIIKFSLMFPDTIAPESLNVDALNYPNAKNKIILTWNKDDAIIYKIYYSNIDFKDKKISELRANIELSNGEEIEDIDLNKCEFKPENEPCKFDKYNKKLESNKLYFIKKEDKYAYILDLDKDYYFLVTAIDESNNEINNIEDKNYKTIKKKNLLPLMMVTNLRVEQIGKDVKLTWNKPEKYKDGSNFKDEELKGYKIRLIEKKKNSIQIIPQDDYIKIKEHIFNNILIEDYYFYVVAFNNNDIASDYASYP